ncbi:formate dehydrogenase subunit gamma [Roseospira marina]|uniref:Formate dehydrogenase subunit gamma n=1 Tax=Roseospira marina TaxID=140057 RepID=A0A5M6ICK9_9PROT|nr:formate dehydrogenase subunit gamma [Roseospira marina]KAA5605485.1 formate dehydrogenase subunit gamma [Roseospira marina]MBB4314512.1 formate dehydrogenase subunit gamma [Roseospira marina]MBB5088660.1 formate dehydrogenase subunit gamma [Roseospira marina]
MAERSPWAEDRARAIVDDHRAMPGALLPLLHALQEEFGCIDEPAVPLLADALNLSRAEVHGVVTFYQDFRRTRPGRHVVKVCRAEACQAVGAESLLDHVKRTLAVSEGETTPDGAFTLEAVYCLGNCALGPAVMIDDTLHGRVGPARFDALAKTHRAEDPA